MQPGAQSSRLRRSAVASARASVGPQKSSRATARAATLLAAVTKHLGGSWHLIKQAKAWKQVAGNPARGANAEGVSKMLTRLALHSVIRKYNMGRVRGK